MRSVVLISTTPLVSASDLYKLCVPLERCAKTCSDWWEVPAVTVDVVENVERIPPGSMPIFFVDGSEIRDGALAWHYFDPLRGRPAARVYVGKTTGFNTGESSVCELAAHELVEAMVDPLVDKWVAHPFLEDGCEVAIEIADPCQTYYVVPHKNVLWRMANFVLPAYFDPELSQPSKRRAYMDRGLRFDVSGELSFPGDVGPHGYTTLRHPTVGGGWRLSVERAGRKPVEWNTTQLASKSHPLSRTKLRSSVLS